MKEKIKFSNFFYQGLTLFLAIGAAIVLYFLILRFDIILDFIVKIFTALGPIFIGLLFAYFLNPIVAFFEEALATKLSKKIFDDKKSHKRFERVISIFITYFIVCTIIFLFIKFVIPNLLESIQLMLTNIPIYINNIYAYAKELLKTPEWTTSIENLNTTILEYVSNVMVPSMDTLMTNIASGITGFIRGVINVIIGLIVSVYIIFDKETFSSGTQKVLKALLPENIYDGVMTTMLYTDKIFGGFMMAKIIDSLIIGFLTFIIISLFNIPYALVISVIVGVTNIIPYFGPFIGAIPSALLLLMIDPGKSLTFIILIFLIQQFDGNILGPRLIGNKTGIKSFWVLFAILLFGGLFGFVGMIFGVPIFAVIYSVLASIIDKKLAKKKAQ